MHQTHAFAVEHNPEKIDQLTDLVIELAKLVNVEPMSGGGARSQT